MQNETEQIKRLNNHLCFLLLHLTCWHIWRWHSCWLRASKIAQDSHSPLKALQLYKWWRKRGCAYESGWWWSRSDWEHSFEIIDQFTIPEIHYGNRSILHQIIKVHFVHFVCFAGDPQLVWEWIVSYFSFIFLFIQICNYATFSKLYNISLLYKTYKADSFEN